MHFVFGPRLIYPLAIGNINEAGCMVQLRDDPARLPLRRMTAAAGNATYEGRLAEHRRQTA